jgi:hypothetical protein
MLKISSCDVQSGCGIHQAYCLMATGLRTAGVWNWLLTVLLPRLRMIGAVSLLPLYAFIAWAAKNSTSICLTNLEHNVWCLVMCMDFCRTCLNMCAVLYCSGLKYSDDNNKSNTTNTFTFNDTNRLHVSAYHKPSSGQLFTHSTSYIPIYVHSTGSHMAYSY